MAFFILMVILFFPGVLCFRKKKFNMAAIPPGSRSKISVPFSTIQVYIYIYVCVCVCVCVCVYTPVFKKLRLEKWYIYLSFVFKYREQKIKDENKR